MKSFKMYTGKTEGTPGSTKEEKEKNTRAIITLLFFIAAAWFLLGGGFEKLGNKNLDDIKQSVASDAVQQYNIAKSNGNKIDACVQAGFVVAAYLQAQDAESYRSWKLIEDRDCAAAGIPR